MTSLSFAIHELPIGDALLAFTDDGLVTLSVVHGDLDAELAGLALRLHTVPEHDEERAGGIVSQLDEYFDGARRDFDVTLDWRLVRGFTRAALEAVCEVPYGETASYGEVAAMAGSGRAHRAVGTACATTPFSIVVPVHRVVRADGSIGEYGGHPEVKRFLLDLEAGAGE
jgi:methylated-DNA-[protein]-cysteine S-methyltransferase